MDGNIRMVNTPEQSKKLAQDIAQQATKTREEKKNILKSALTELENINPALGGFEETGFNQTQTTRPPYLEEKMDEPVFDPNQARFTPASQSNISKRNGGFNTYPQQPPKSEIPTFGGFDSGSKSNIVIPQKPIKNGY